MSNRQYVFITPNIDGIGGAQRYIACKSAWLMERGWSVTVFTLTCSSPVLLPFNGVNVVNIKELALKPSCLSSKQVARIVELMQSSLCSNGEAFIESSTLSLSYWGELLAKAVRARHLVFHLAEMLPVLSRDERRFFALKDSHHELAFISEDFYKSIFPVESRSSGEHFLLARMGSNVVDISFDDLRDGADCSVGVISRLEKPYLFGAINGLVSFCSNHPDKKVLLDIVGDSPDKSINSKIEAMAGGSPNLHIVFRGALAEIPRGLLDSWDVALCKAGAAGLTSRAGVPTIQYGIETDECVGVRCFDFDPNQEGDLGTVHSTEECLERILVRGVCVRGQEKWDEPAYVSDFSSHLSYTGDQQNKYFDTKKCKPTFLSFLSAKYHLLFGAEPPIKRRL